MPVTPEAQASMDALKALRKDPMSDNEATATAEQEVQGKKLIAYSVFAYSTSEAYPQGHLVFYADVEAANDIKAIDLARGSVTSGDFVAIPRRSLKVRTVSSVSVPKVSIA